MCKRGILIPGALRTVPPGSLPAAVNRESDRLRGWPCNMIAVASSLTAVVTFINQRLHVG